MMMRETLDVFTADEDRVIVNLNALIDFFFFFGKCTEYKNQSQCIQYYSLGAIGAKTSSHLFNFFYWGLDGGDGQPRLVQPKTHVPKPTVGYNLSHLFLDLTFMFAFSILKQGQAAK